MNIKKALQAINNIIEAYLENLPPQYLSEESFDQPGLWSVIKSWFKR